MQNTNSTITLYKVYLVLYPSFKYITICFDEPPMSMFNFRTRVYNLNFNLTNLCLKYMGDGNNFSLVEELIFVDTKQPNQFAQEFEHLGILNLKSILELNEEIKNYTIKFARQLKINVQIRQIKFGEKASQFCDILGSTEECFRRACIKQAKRKINQKKLLFGLKHGESLEPKEYSIKIIFNEIVERLFKVCRIGRKLKEREEKINIAWLSQEQFLEIFQTPTHTIPSSLDELNWEITRTPTI